MQEIDIHRVPRPVCKAVNLLWLLLAIGVIRGIVFPSAPSAAIPGWLTIAIRILVVGSMCYFIWKVRAGRNWARKVQLALFVFTMTLLVVQAVILPRFVPKLPLFKSLVDMGLSALQLGLEGYALFLLFTSLGSAWFVARIGRTIELPQL